MYKCKLTAQLESMLAFLSAQNEHIHSIDADSNDGKCSIVTNVVLVKAGDDADEIGVG